jgi:hypothetical protein
MYGRHLPVDAQLMLDMTETGLQPGTPQVPFDNGRVRPQLLEAREGRLEQRVLDGGRERHHQQPAPGRQRLGQATKRVRRIGHVMHRLLQAHRIELLVPATSSAEATTGVRPTGRGGDALGR